MATGHEVIPGARRLINSLRDIGYDFPSAVADIVDNSIGAGAKVVTINVHFAGDESWVCISDNGSGMSPAQLREAMRYGAERDYDDEELGKFGLGLKTASMSQCQRLTVATRSSASRANVTAYCWDLNHIERTNRWEILPILAAKHKPDIVSALKSTPGTVVLWERLDRILGYQHPYGENAKKRLSTMCRELEEHLAMVFHRFLAGEIRGKKLQIILNGNPVAAWDPFARTEQHTKSFDNLDIPVSNDAVSGDVLVQPYILPPQSLFSSPASHLRAGGPNKWNRQQGLYIYRSGRMIQSGGWSNLRTIDEHTKLARVAVNFAPRLDDAFKINVAKMRVQLPLQLRSALEKALGTFIKQANNAYRKGSSGKPISGPARAPRAKLPGPIVTFPERRNGQEQSPPDKKRPLQLAHTDADNQITVSPSPLDDNADVPAGLPDFEPNDIDSFAELAAACATPEERPVIERVVIKMKEMLDKTSAHQTKFRTDNADFS